MWTKVPRNGLEGVLLGNGQLGASIFGDEKALRWTLHRQDVADRRSLRAEQWDSPLFDTCRLLIGSFELRPVGKVTDFQGRLDLWNALGKGTLTTDKGKISWRTFVHAAQPLIVMEFTTEGQERDFTFRWTPASSSSPRAAPYLNNPKFKIDYEPNPPARVDHEKGLSIHPLKAGGQFAVAWQERRPEENKRVYLATVAHQAGPLEVSASVDDLFSAHQRVWQGRYPASFVSIPDARAESYYWINTYLLYSTTRADQPPIDVHGMWFFGSAWPNVWWNINVQHAYYSQATANRLELAESLCGTLEKHEENLSLNIPVKAWQADSAWVGRISDQQLRSSWPQVQYMKGILTRLDPPTSYEPEKAWPHGAEVANLSWAMELYWRQCRWAADDQRLSEKFLPLLEKCLNLYRHLLMEGDDGKLHLPVTHSPELGDYADCNYDLGALQWSLKTLIRESERLGVNEGKVADWKTLQAKITPHPQGPDGLWLGANKPLRGSHRHPSHLLAFYPLAVLDWDKPADRDLIRRSVDHWYGDRRYFIAFSYTAAASMYATMERPDEAWAALNTYLDNYAKPNTICRDTTLETSLGFCQNVHDLLLQSRNGIIRVFPAVPSGWPDAIFHDLRTEGAFLVSAERKGGKTRWVRVKSLAGEPCRVKVSFAGEPSLVSGKLGVTFKSLGEDLYELGLTKGQELVLAAEPDAPMVVKALPVQAGQENPFGLRYPASQKPGR